MDIVGFGVSWHLCSIEHDLFVDGWGGNNLRLSIRTLNDRAPYLLQMTQSETQLRCLIGQHADASNGSSGIAPASVGLDADAGADVSDSVGKDECEVVSRSGIEERSYRAVDVEPDEVLSAITIKIDDQGGLAEISVFDSQGRRMFKNMGAILATLQIRATREFEPVVDRPFDVVLRHQEIELPV